MVSARQDQPALLSVFDWFCGDEEEASLDRDFPVRRRVLVGFLLSQLLILPACTIYSLLFSTVDPEQAVKSAWLTGGMALWYGGILFVSRFARNFYLCVNGALAGILLAVFGYIGSIQSQIPESHFLLAIVPTLGFCLLGLRLGAIWLVLAAGALVWLHFGDGPRVVALDYPAADIRTVEAIMWLVASTSTMSLQFTYAYLTHALGQRLHEEKQRLLQMAVEDELTGLGNRKLLNARLATALAQARRGGMQLAVVYIDINGLKAVNDRYGHTAGDAVLRESARRMAGGLRAGDIAARIGGDEFALLLSPLSGREGMNHVIRRLDAHLAQPLRFEGYTLPMSAAMGGAVYPFDGESAEQLLHAADRAMYNAKHAKKLQQRLVAEVNAGEPALGKPAGAVEPEEASSIA